MLGLWFGISDINYKTLGLAVTPRPGLSDSCSDLRFSVLMYAQYYPCTISPPGCYVLSFIYGTVTLSMFPGNKCFAYSMNVLCVFNSSQNSEW